ncbi:MAG: S1 RNA-binding domain-containing protein [Acutalibacteraceae bacterium]
MGNLIPSKQHFFVNPYNFVSQSIQVNRSRKDYSDIVSGVITCRIIVKDKLAMPDHENRNNRKVKGQKYDFFRINNVPIVTGSEIRGCIRSIYETLTGSCYSVINSNTLTKRVPVCWNDVATPCIVRFENGNWCLYRARKLSKDERKCNGNTGYMRRWKASPRIKNLDFITQYYDFDGNMAGIFCNDKMPGFYEVIKIYLKNNQSDQKFIECIEALKQAIDHKQPFVAFYKETNGRITYFSPAQLGGRNAYENTVSDLLGEYAPCSGKKGYCPACSLFGTINTDLPTASKIRFTDALPTKEIKLDDYVMLPPLSSPKTTSVEFYSLNGNNFTDVPQWDYDSNGVVLRGRKYYFHSKPQTAEVGKDLVMGQFSTRTAPAGSEFAFKVYFDSISQKDQLAKLLWCLTLGENFPDSSRMQKIGVGKPVGYGSVKILVDHIAVRKTEEMNYSVSSLNYNDTVACETMFDSLALKELKRISDYNYVLNEKVSYPIADDGKNRPNSKSAHQWFSANRPTSTSVFRYALARIEENPSALRLPAMYADEKKQPSKKVKTNVSDTEKPEIGKIYEGIITGIKPYGAFVKINGSGISGLIRINEIANSFVTDINDYLQKDQTVKVKCIEITNKGVSFSIKRCL